MRISKYSQFDKLQPVYIFEYYDFPLFFLSTSSDEDSVFINYYVEELENNIDKWLFGRITNKEKVDLVEQRLSVLNLLENLRNNNRLYYLYIQFDQEELNLELIESSNFDKECFPEEDYYVSYDYLSNKELVKIEQDFLDSSEFKLVLEDEKSSHSVGLDFLTNTLNVFKETLNEFAKAIGDTVIGEEYKGDIQLNVNAFQPSSFGITLNSELDIFGIPERSLSNLFMVLEEVKYNKFVHIEEQLDIDKIYSIESIKSLYKLLNLIYRNKYSLRLEAKSTLNRNDISVDFDKKSYDKLKILKDILNRKNKTKEEEIKVIGILTSINTTYNKFRIDVNEYVSGDNKIELNDGLAISGKMSKELFDLLKIDTAKKFIVPSKIKAVILKESEINYVEDKEIEKYTLIEYDQL